MKYFLFVLVTLILFSCGTKKVEEPQFSIPAGMTIRSQFTTRMDYENKPVDDITYIPPSLQEVTIYSTFDGISQEQHGYQWLIENAQGQPACPQEDTYYWTPGGTSENVWTKISVAKCLSSPGDYTLKVYLDGNWVLMKTLKVLSQEEIASGKYEAYWNKDKYMAVLPAAKLKQKGEWIVQMVGSEYSSLSNLFVVPHNGFNRVFAVGKTDDNYVVKEQTNYGMQDVFVFERGERDQPWTIQYKVVGNELFMFNAYVKNSFHLTTGELKTNIDLPFTPVLEGFASPGGKHSLSRNGLLDGKPVLNATTCTNPEVSWASWSSDDQKVYFKINCRNQETISGVYQRDLASGQSQRILEDFEWITSIAYFNNNGNDFIALLEKEEGQSATKIKFATQTQFYSELSFGPNYYWSGSLTLPLTEEIKDELPLSVNFLSQPEQHSAYSFIDDSGMGSKDGSILRIGTINGGELNGKDLYKIRDNESWEDKGFGGSAYYTIENQYLVRNGDELIIFNLPQTEEKRESFTFPDLDGKRKKSELFKGVTKVVHYQNQLIAGLLSEKTLSIPNSAVRLTREGIVGDFGDKSDYRKMFVDEREGEIYAKQSDDGSFWRFNGDQTATLYRYGLDFGVTLDGEALAMDDYAPYTNRDCGGAPIDFAHIITPDPSRLRQAGETTDKEPVYVFNSDNDETLKQEYELLSKAYADSDQTFKTFKEFVASKPLFLWKDPFGRYVRFVRKENLSPTNCEPILYLYPEVTTDVAVALGDNVNVIASLPKLNETWQVRAQHNGALVDLSTSKKYDHIFWEGISGFLPPLQKGFVVETKNLSAFFDEKLSQLGLNEKERQDFKAAWIKEMNEAPYYFIGFYEKSVIDKYAPMDITPAPETVIRILMDYKPLNEPISVEAPDEFSIPSRKGFTVVEWGGLKR